MSRYSTLMGALNPLSPESHPELHKAAAELCEKAGLKVPSLHVIDPSKLGNNFSDIILKSTPAATFYHGGQHHIYLGESILPVLGMEKLTSPVSEEIKAVISHELGHIKRGDDRILGFGRMAQHTPLACLIGALAVTKYLHYRHENKLKEAEQPDGLPKDQSNSRTISTASAVGHYLLAAITGLGIGIFASKHMRHHMEYACDTFSKQLMGSGAPMISAFEKLKAFQESEMQKIIVKKSLTPHQVETLKSFTSTLEAMFHPPVDSRIAALR